MKLTEAKAIANKWLQLLAPHCERIEIAGSIRRGKQDVKDIEIVCIPKLATEPDLFGGAGTEINLLEVAIQKLFWDRAYLAMTKKGPRYKQLALPEGIKLDLFIALPASVWGVQFLIRTGPAEFSHWVVSSKRLGGALPSNLKVKDGAIWNGARKLNTPDELDVFHVLGLEFVEPCKRIARWAGVVR